MHNKRTETSLSVPPPPPIHHHHLLPTSTSLLALPSSYTPAGPGRAAVMVASSSRCSGFFSFLFLLIPRRPLPSFGCLGLMASLLVIPFCTTPQRGSTRPTMASRRHMGSLGCAPTPSQYFTRDTSNWISFTGFPVPSGGGFGIGSYVPITSIGRELRAVLLLRKSLRVNFFFFSGGAKEEMIDWGLWLCGCLLGSGGHTGLA